MNKSKETRMKAGEGEEQSGARKKKEKEDAKIDLWNSVEQARRYIIHGRVEEANKLVFDTLQGVLSLEIFEDSAIELLPAYFIMAEANVCMGGARLKKAEEFLIAAYWNLLKHTSDENKTAAEESLVSEQEVSQYRASLHKTFGRLFTSQKRFEDAIKELAHGIYLDCVEHGPESYKLCSSYYYIGLIFQQMNKNEEAKSFYQKIIQIWKRFILERDLKDAEDMQYGREAGEWYSSIDDIYYEEAKDHIKNMLVFFEVEYGPQHVLTAECELAFALVMLKTGNVMVSLEFL